MIVAIRLENVKTYVGKVRVRLKMTKLQINLVKTVDELSFFAVAHGRPTFQDNRVTSFLIGKRETKTYPILHQKTERCCSFKFFSKMLGF